jgi:broad specificity phosphatase PhoE
VANAQGRLAGRADFELSEAGRAQAGRLHARFRQEGFRPTHVYSSPLRRTFETAQIVSRSWEVPITGWEDLQEHDVGVFSGLTWEEIHAKYPAIATEVQERRHWDIVPGAETLPAKRARARRVVEAVLDRHSDGDEVILFTHGGILHWILAALLGTDRTWGVPAQNAALFDFTLNAERWSLEGDGRHDPSLWRIHRFNDASHI